MSKVTINTDVLSQTLTEMLDCGRAEGMAEVLRSDDRDPRIEKCPVMGGDWGVLTQDDDGYGASERRVGPKEVAELIRSGYARDAR